MTNRYCIPAVGEIVDGEGSLEGIQAFESKLTAAGLRYQQYEIVDLKCTWSANLDGHQFRGATSAIEAIEKGKRELSAGRCDAVIVSGKDFLRSDWKGREDERKKTMDVYGPKKSPLTGYNEVAHQYCLTNDLSRPRFLELAQAVFRNFCRVFQERFPEKALPHQRWYEHITPYFRGVDCANPSIDYEGAFGLMTQEAAEGIGYEHSVMLEASSLKTTGVDGWEGIPSLLPYTHLKDAFDDTLSQTSYDYLDLFKNGAAGLEVYSCFPIVPIAFLIATKMVSSFDEIEGFLERYPITLSGGLNLNKAPWNNTTLRSIIDMTRLIAEQRYETGLIHSNGSLGYKQGLVLLSK